MYGSLDEINPKGIFMLLNVIATADWYNIVSFPLFLPYALILFHIYYKSPLLFFKIFPEIKLAKILVGLPEFPYKASASQIQIKKCSIQFFSHVSP